MKSLDDLVDDLNREILEITSSACFYEDPRIDFRCVKQIFSLEELLSPSSNKEFVSGAYISILHRDVDEGAMAWYCGCLDSGEKTRHQLIEELLTSSEGIGVACAVIGIADSERILLSLVKETAANTQRVGQIYAELLHIKQRLGAIPKAQSVFLKAVYNYVDHALSHSSSKSLPINSVTYNKN